MPTRRGNMRNPPGRVNREQAANRGECQPDGAIASPLRAAHAQIFMCAPDGRVSGFAERREAPIWCGRDSPGSGGALTQGQSRAGRRSPPALTRER